MANKIPTEIIIKILNNVQSTQDLYSSLLVNRIWCKVTIPILWKLPLSQEYYYTDYKLKKKELCIRTYISCMDNKARKILIKNKFDLSSSPPQSTFDYPSFTHKLIINNLVYFVSKYSPQIISSSPDQIEKLKILFTQMCKLIIGRCSFLDYFELAKVHRNFSRDFLNYKHTIGSIFKLRDAKKAFEKLKSFTSMIGEEEICSVYESLKLICNNILNMDLQLNTYYQVKLLVELISVQKHLENLSITDQSFLDNDSIIWAIISQKETLKSLRLDSIRFHEFKAKSSPIGKFTSIQKLYMTNCYGFYKDSLFFASSFAQLSSFHFYNSNRSTLSSSSYTQKFVIKILETANTNLKEIYLDLYFTIPFDTFSAISNYCTKITKLSLQNLSSEHLLAIFNNIFNELRRFSFSCWVKEGFDANELLCQMVKNIPESLETIEIRMGIFSSDSLQKFYEEWCCKGGGNKKIIVSDNDFVVLEEYGVQIDIEE